MARYRLTAPHFVNRANGIPAYLEAGVVIDSLEMPPHWVPTPLMIPLDAVAEADHARVTREAIRENGPSISGIGHARDLHNGQEHLDAEGFKDTP